MRGDRRFARQDLHTHGLSPLTGILGWALPRHTTRAILFCAADSVRVGVADRLIQIVVPVDRAEQTRELIRRAEGVESWHDSSDGEQWAGSRTVAARFP